MGQILKDTKMASISCDSCLKSEPHFPSAQITRYVRHFGASAVDLMHPDPKP